MRKYIAVLLAGGLAFGLVGGAEAAKKSKAVKVFDDSEGDAGNDTAGALPGATEAGFDLTGGTIAKKGSNLNFTVTHSAMPETGTLPEGFRFLWHFDADGKQYRLTVKSANIGKPDAASQSGTERVGQVDTNGHFRIEECYTDSSLPINLSVCKPVAYLKGSFNAAKAGFGFTLPLKTLKLKPGKSTIGASTMSVSTTSGCPICWVPEQAERSLTPYTIIDSASMLVPYTVPKK